MVVKTAFSDAWIRSLPPPAKAQELHWDARLPTFGLRVGKTAKTFIIKLNNDFITIGRFGVLGLAEARGEARRILAERTLGKVRPQSITYPQATKLFIQEKRERRRPSTVHSLERHLAQLDLKSQVADITHEDIERRIKRLTQGEYNHRLAALKAFFNWCQKRRYRADNPTIGFTPYSRPTRSRVLTDAELQSIWRACERRLAFDDEACGRFQTTMPEIVKLPRTFAAIVQLLLLTGQRRGEIAALRADYISNDTCTLPSTLTKNKREHTFPIGSLTATLLSSALPTSLTPSKSETLLFPARGSSSSPFNGWSKSKAALDRLSGVSGWTLHDARRTFATRLAELAVSPHVIERLLNHVTGTVSGVAAVYNRATYMAEMRAAIELWERYLQEKILCCTA